MSVAQSPLPRPRRGTSMTTIVVAALLVVVLVVTGVGLAGWAALTFFSGGDGGGGRRADPPKPSTAAVPAAYAAELAQFYEQDLDWRSCGANQCTRLTAVSYTHLTLPTIYS